MRRHIRSREVPDGGAVVSVCPEVLGTCISSACGLYTISCVRTYPNVVLSAGPDPGGFGEVERQRRGHIESVELKWHAHETTAFINRALDLPA